MEFTKLKVAVATKFKKMSQTGLFRTAVGGDELWQKYLASFPEDSNPIFRERTEHDCSCCRQFIRSVGNLVSISDSLGLESIWDCEVPGEPEYQVVANAMAKLVKSKPILCEFLSTEKVAGTDKNFEDMVDGVKVWEHFFFHVPKEFVRNNKTIGSETANSKSTHDVFLRALEELSTDSINTVLELIDQNSLYRGEEHRFAVDAFHKCKVQFDALKKSDKDKFVWLKAKTAPGSVTGIRNSVIGSLLIDLNNDVDLELAVRSFEAKVAPMNYRRPTALVTESMVKKAKETIQELGLLSALERRHATMADVKVNDLLFVDRQTAKLNGDVFDSVMETLPKQMLKNLDRVENVSMGTFVKDILPHAKSVEILFENRLADNLMSLVAPSDPTAPNLFKWDNAFSWTYRGEVADSIAERVKKAGGNIEGDLCCRLAWFNYDDLDLHLVEPSGYEIYFKNKRCNSPLGGMLDVDMNAGGGHTRQPVENIFYRTRRGMEKGTYSLSVHNFNLRERKDIGFEVEIDALGTVFSFSHPNIVPHKQSVHVADIVYDGVAFKVNGKLPSTLSSKEMWGLRTNDFCRINSIMLSPNHWGERPVGNKHYFFIVQGCKNPGPARGFYNEFLREDLNIHRKVFEVVGGKLQLSESDEQLSGLGFSTTKKDKLTVRVKGNFSRVVNVII